MNFEAMSSPVTPSYNPLSSPDTPRPLKGRHTLPEQLNTFNNPPFQAGQKGRQGCLSGV